MHADIFPNLQSQLQDENDKLSFYRALLACYACIARYFAALGPRPRWDGWRA